MRARSASDSSVREANSGMFRCSPSSHPPYREQILSTHPSAGALKHVVNSLAFVSGVPFTSHTLRRTFAVRLVELGIEREVVGDLLGHAPATVTVGLYTPITWPEKVRAIQRLEY